MVRRRLSNPAMAHWTPCWAPINQERRKPDVDPCCRVVVYHPQKPVDYSDVKIRKDMKF